MRLRWPVAAALLLLTACASASEDSAALDTGVSAPTTAPTTAPLSVEVAPSPTAIAIPPTTVAVPTAAPEVTPTAPAAATAVPAPTAAAGTAAVPATATEVPVQGSNEVLVANGGEVYTLNCARCHAENGFGTERYGGLVGVGSQYSSQAMIQELTNGHPVTFGFADKLSADEIASVVAYVKAVFS